jgi:hypothetical protein
MNDNPLPRSRPQIGTRITCVVQGCTVTGTVVRFKDAAGNEPSKVTLAVEGQADQEFPESSILPGSIPPACSLCLDSGYARTGPLTGSFCECSRGRVIEKVANGN